MSCGTTGGTELKSNLAHAPATCATTLHRSGCAECLFCLLQKMRVCPVACQKMAARHPFPSGCSYMMSVGATTNFGRCAPFPSYQASAVSFLSLHTGQCQCGPVKCLRARFPDVAAQGEWVEMVYRGNASPLDGYERSCAAQRPRCGTNGLLGSGRAFEGSEIQAAFSVIREFTPASTWLINVLA
ncbi:hypothetical protein B0H21DRAFT_33998 [Amylocystis lapponica]|nr:hypothetical protein B0H21DRAFT_33998 [Amylocystis lapponica]